MKRIALITVLPVLLFLALQTDVSAGQYRDKNRALTVEAVIPPGLSEHLLEAGIDLTVYRIRRLGTALSSLESASGQAAFLVLQSPDGTGLMLSRFGSRYSETVFSGYLFNTLDDSYHTLDHSIECLEQIASMMQSFVFVLYDCMFIRDERFCLGSVMTFMTDIFLMRIICQRTDQPETP